MRICFVSRRFFPAISGMSIYALNLLRELVADGHDVTMISQYYDGAHATVYGGGPPPDVSGVKVIGLPALGEQEHGDFESDIETIIGAVKREHAIAPFDVLHAQYGYPTGWAVLLASADIGVPCVVSIQGGDGHWVGSCCETHYQAFRRVLDHAGALLIGGESFIAEVSERNGRATLALHPRAGRGRHRKLQTGPCGRHCRGPASPALSWSRRPAERRARLH